MKLGIDVQRFISDHVHLFLTFQIDERILDGRSYQSFHTVLVSGHGRLASIATYSAAQMVPTGLGHASDERNRYGGSYPQYVDKNLFVLSKQVL